jgi:hypothetical protein
MRTQRFAIACLTLLCAAWTVGAYAQQPDGPRRGRGRPTPAEVQELFDRYTLTQARDVLQLSDRQAADFESRMTQLHQTRRRNHQERLRLLGQLNQILEEPKTDEQELRRALQALDEHDGRAAAELKRAYAGVDEVLDLRQRARYRVFEERLEQRKFDLLMRARQNRASPRRRPEP